MVNTDTKIIYINYSEILTPDILVHTSCIWNLRRSTMFGRYYNKNNDGWIVMWI